MKPTRKIPVTRMTGIWKPKRSVWFKKNNDDDLGKKPYSREDSEKLRKHFIRVFASAEGEDNGEWYGREEKGEYKKYRRNNALKKLKEEQK